MFRVIYIKNIDPVMQFSVTGDWEPAEKSISYPDSRVEVMVWYESGYKWSVLVNREDETRSTELNKNEAVKLAKMIAADVGGLREIQTMTKEEKSNAVKDRWNFA